MRVPGAVSLLSFATVITLLGLVGAAVAKPPPDKLWTDAPSAAEGGLDPEGPVSMRAFSDLAKALSPSVVNISVDRAAAGRSHPLAPLFGFRGESGRHGQLTGFDCCFWTPQGVQAYALWLVVHCST